MTNSPVGSIAPPLATTAVFGGTESAALRELRTLVLSRNSGIAIETEDEERADALLQAMAHGLDLPLVPWSISTGLKVQSTGNYVSDSDKPARAIRAMEEYIGDAIFVLKDFTQHLDEPAVSRALKELLDRFAKPPCLSTVILVGSDINLPKGFETNVATFDIKLPEAGEYERAIHGVIESLLLNRHSRIEISAGQVPEFASALRGLTLNQARRAVARVAIEDGRLSLEDLTKLVELKAEMLERGGLLELIPADAIDAQLGGFAGLQRWLGRQQLAFGEEARALNLPAPKGVLLVGVQGCGKSLAAKAIAKSWNLPLLRLDAGRLYDKFVGESEKNFRQVISIAESLAPTVLWIDEIEKGMRPSGSGEVDGGLSQRLFGSFLTWLQEKRSGVFVVATANDLSALPPELLRKGRFDEVFFVDLPTPDERIEIFRIHLTFRRQDPAQFDLPALAAATEGFSGAEIEHVVVTSLLEALQSRVPADTNSILRVIGSIIPLSVSRRADIEQLRARAEEQFVPVR